LEISLEKCPFCAAGILRFLHGEHRFSCLPYATIQVASLEEIMATPVVFVIDMLNDCFHHAELDQIRTALCSSINTLTSLARARGFPVVWVRQEFESDLSDAFMDMKRDNIRMFINGTRGPLILDELVRGDSNIEMVKKRYSMFYGTGLDEMLQQLHAESIILAGVNSHACIRTAAIDAYQRDFPVTIVSDCVASKDVGHHEISMNYMDGGIASVVTLCDLQKRFSP
jgi:nicotinamidase-related amidase